MSGDAAFLVRACRARMPKQCQGIARSGKRCSITSTSQLTNDSGRLAADPLKRGGDYCLFHAKPFCTKEIEEHLDRQLVIILILRRAESFLHK